MNTMTDQTAYWIGLNMTPGIGSATMQLLLNSFGSAEVAWNAHYADLLEAGLGVKAAESLILTRKTLNLDAQVERLAKEGAHILTWNSDSYPKRLLEVGYAPPVLYVLGELTESDNWAVGVVGTRRSTSYGREAPARLVFELVKARITIISGLAKGIDTTAHRAALDAGGRTIAVLGSGIDVIYPPENRQIVKSIFDNGTGAIITDYP